MKRKMISKITAVVSLILCLSFLIGGNAVAYDTENTPNTVGVFSFAAETIFEVLDSFTDFGKTETDGIGSSSQISTPFLIVLVHETPELFGKIKTILFVGTKVKIKSFSGNYCLVEKNGETVGYVHKFWLSGGKDGKLSFNKSFEHVYSDGTNYNASTGKPRTQAVYDGSGKIFYSSSNDDIISVDPETGLITGKKPGKAKLIASVGAERAVCEVYCIYKWKKFWTGSANKATTIYGGTSSDTQTVSSLPKNTKFYVRGDDGGSEGWAYGYATVNGTNYYGFVQIGDISTKGTVSQYNSMGWSYPIKRDLFKHISSPYGWRGGYRHLGLDINRQGNTAIEGEITVAPFNGTVVYANTSYNASTKKPDYGYCVVIEADDHKDPVSGKKLRVVYMHFLEKPMVDIEDSVIAGKTELGKVGSTGNSSGPHLHLEINNKGTNFAGSTNSDSFDKTVNPTFFYLNSGLKDGSDSTYNEYWYNDNK